MQTLELLAPAKNLECGIAAIDHGADAVYIGAPRFGARAAAGNSLEDIRQLCDYAHQFGAKVHVTVNTIIYQDEMLDTLKMIQQLDEIGVDALLLQDMGVLTEVRAQNLWSRELHSSTQCDVRTPEKAFWLTTLGFKRVVLARELSLDEIKAIHQAIPDREIEVFVHGALCVSYSGVCYASEKCFGRSANRGATILGPMQSVVLLSAIHCRRDSAVARNCGRRGHVFLQADESDGWFLPGIQLQVASVGHGSPRLP